MRVLSGVSRERTNRTTADHEPSSPEVTCASQWKRAQWPLTTSLLLGEAVPEMRTGATIWLKPLEAACSDVLGRGELIVIAARAVG